MRAEPGTSEIKFEFKVGPYKFCLGTNEFGKRCVWWWTQYYWALLIDGATDMNEEEAVHTVASLICFNWKPEDPQKAIDTLRSFNI
jgi:hypothetical protein